MKSLNDVNLENCVLKSILRGPIVGWAVQSYRDDIKGKRPVKPIIDRRRTAEGVRRGLGLFGPSRRRELADLTEWEVSQAG